MQKILDIISSKKFRNIFCFLVFTLLMTASISSQNFFFQKVIENNIALRDVIAEKDIRVIDTVKTEQHKKEVAQNVECSPLFLSLPMVRFCGMGRMYFPWMDNIGSYWDICLRILVVTLIFLSMII